LEHEDPAMARFLSILEKDIEAGRNVGELPDEMASSMLSALNRHVDDEIYGDVEI
jgi:antitoxin PrlF